MSREEEVNYEQDRLGNERKKLDKLRAQEGAKAGGGPDGIVEITSADTGNTVTVLAKPSHADAMNVVQIQAKNTNPQNGSNFSLYEGEDISGSITSSTRRSVPINVQSGSTRIEEYKGLPFDKSIGINSEFEGWVGVSVISDHNPENETNSENF